MVKKRPRCSLTSQQALTCLLDQICATTASITTVLAEIRELQNARQKECLERPEKRPRTGHAAQRDKLHVEEMTLLPLLQRALLLVDVVLDPLHDGCSQSARPGGYDTPSKYCNHLRMTDSIVTENSQTDTDSGSRSDVRQVQASQQCGLLRHLDEQCNSSPQLLPGGFTCTDVYGIAFPVIEQLCCGDIPTVYPAVRSSSIFLLCLGSWVRCILQMIMTDVASYIEDLVRSPPNDVRQNGQKHAQDALTLKSSSASITAAVKAVVQKDLSQCLISILFSETVETTEQDLRQHQEELVQSLSPSCEPTSLLERSWNAFLWQRSDTEPGVFYLIPSLPSLASLPDLILEEPFDTGANQAIWEQHRGTAAVLDVLRALKSTKVPLDKLFVSLPVAASYILQQLKTLPCTHICGLVLQFVLQRVIILLSEKKVQRDAGDSQMSLGSSNFESVPQLVTCAAADVIRSQRLRATAATLRMSVIENLQTVRTFGADEQYNGQGLAKLGRRTGEDKLFSQGLNEEAVSDTGEEETQAPESAGSFLARPWCPAQRSDVAAIVHINQQHAFQSWLGELRSFASVCLVTVRAAPTVPLYDSSLLRLRLISSAALPPSLVWTPPGMSRFALCRRDAPTQCLAILEQKITIFIREETCIPQLQLAAKDTVAVARLHLIEESNTNLLVDLPTAKADQESFQLFQVVPLSDTASVSLCLSEQLDQIQGLESLNLVLTPDHLARRDLDACLELTFFLPQYQLARSKRSLSDSNLANFSVPPLEDALNHHYLRKRFRYPTRKSDVSGGDHNNTSLRSDNDLENHGLDLNNTSTCATKPPEPQSFTDNGLSCVNVAQSNELDAEAMHSPDLSFVGEDSPHDSSSTSGTMDRFIEKPEPRCLRDVPVTSQRLCDHSRRFFYVWDISDSSSCVPHATQGDLGDGFPKEPWTMLRLATGHSFFRVAAWQRKTLQARLRIFAAAVKIAQRYYRCWKKAVRTADRHRLFIGDIFAWGVLPVRAIQHPDQWVPLPAGYQQGSRCSLLTHDDIRWNPAETAIYVLDVNKVGADLRSQPRYKSRLVSRCISRLRQKELDKVAEPSETGTASRGNGGPPVTRLSEHRASYTFRRLQLGRVNSDRLGRQLKTSRIQDRHVRCLLSRSHGRIAASLSIAEIPMWNAAVTALASMYLQGRVSLQQALARFPFPCLKTSFDVERSVLADRRKLVAEHMTSFRATTEGQMRQRDRLRSSLGTGMPTTTSTTAFNKDSSAGQSPSDTGAQEGQTHHTRDWLQASYENLTGPPPRWKRSALYRLGGDRDFILLQPVQLIYVNENQHVGHEFLDCLEQKDVVFWTELEIRIFLFRYFVTPKDFRKIAAAISTAKPLTTTHELRSLSSAISRLDCRSKTELHCADFYYRFKYFFKLKFFLNALRCPKTRGSNHHVNRPGTRRGQWTKDSIITKLIQKLKTACDDLLALRCKLHHEGLLPLTSTTRTAIAPAVLRLWGPLNALTNPSQEYNVELAMSLLQDVHFIDGLALDDGFHSEHVCFSSLGGQGMTLRTLHAAVGLYRLRQLLCGKSPPGRSPSTASSAQGASESVDRLAVRVFDTAREGYFVPCRIRGLLPASGKSIAFNSSLSALGDIDMIVAPHLVLLASCRGIAGERHAVTAEIDAKQPDAGVSRAATVVSDSEKQERFLLGSSLAAARNRELQRLCDPQTAVVLRRLLALSRVSKQTGFDALFFSYHRDSETQSSVRNPYGSRPQAWRSNSEMPDLDVQQRNALLKRLLDDMCVHEVVSTTTAETSRFPTEQNFSIAGITFQRPMSSSPALVKPQQSASHSSTVPSSPADDFDAGGLNILHRYIFGGVDMTEKNKRLLKDACLSSTKDNTNNETDQQSAALVVQLTEEKQDSLLETHDHVDPLSTSRDVGSANVSTDESHETVTGEHMTDQDVQSATQTTIDDPMLSHENELGGSGGDSHAPLCASFQVDQLKTAQESAACDPESDETFLVPAIASTTLPVVVGRARGDAGTPMGSETNDQEKPIEKTKSRRHHHHHHRKDVHGKSKSSRREHQLPSPLAAPGTAGGLSTLPTAGFPLGPPTVSAPSSHHHSFPLGHHSAVDVTAAALLAPISYRGPWTTMQSFSPAPSFSASYDAYAQFAAAAAAAAAAAVAPPDMQSDMDPRLHSLGQSVFSPGLGAAPPPGHSHSPFSGPVGNLAVQPFSSVSTGGPPYLVNPPRYCADIPSSQPASLPARRGPESSALQDTTRATPK